MSESLPEPLWPEEHDTPLASIADNNGHTPNAELAVILLASGCTQAYVRRMCGFESAQAVARFARDEETKNAVGELRKQRSAQVGDLAMVRLAAILRGEGKDVRSVVLAIRTALDVSGTLRHAPPPPTKQVSDLSVAELNELIAMTRSELDRRSGEYRPDGKNLLPAS